LRVEVFKLKLAAIVKVIRGTYAGAKFNLNAQSFIVLEQSFLVIIQAFHVGEEKGSDLSELLGFRMFF